MPSMGMMSVMRNERHPAKKMSTLSLAIRVGVVSAALIVASGIAIDTIEIPFADALTIALARASVYALGLLGTPASANGAVIDANSFAAVIIPQCMAVEILLVFGAAVIVWPVSLRARLWALTLGLATLCALNFARIVSLLLIGVNIPEYLDLAHIKIWQTVMATAALALWLLWAQWASNRESAAGGGSEGETEQRA